MHALKAHCRPPALQVILMHPKVWKPLHNTMLPLQTLFLHPINIFQVSYKGWALLEIQQRLKSAFPGISLVVGPVVENPPFNEGDTGSIPGRGAKIPHTVGQLNPSTTTREASMAQPLISSALEPMLHNRRSPHPATRKRKSLCTSMETQCIEKKKKKCLLS